MKPKDRTYTKTGINWDSFFNDCGVYGMRSLPKTMMKSVYSAAKTRGYKCEVQDPGGSHMCFKLTSDCPKYRMLKAFSTLDDKQLKAIYKAAIQFGLIKNDT